MLSQYSMHTDPGLFPFPHDEVCGIVDMLAEKKCCFMVVFLECCKAYQKYFLGNELFVFNVMQYSDFILFLVFEAFIFTQAQPGRTTGFLLASSVRDLQHA